VRPLCLPCRSTTQPLEGWRWVWAGIQWVCCFSLRSVVRIGLNDSGCAITAAVLHPQHLPGLLARHCKRALCPFLRDETGEPAPAGRRICAALLRLAVWPAPHKWRRAARRAVATAKRLPARYMASSVPPLRNESEERPDGRAATCVACKLLTDRQPSLGAGPVCTLASQLRSASRQQLCSCARQIATAERRLSPLRWRLCREHRGKAVAAGLGGAGESWARWFRPCVARCDPHANRVTLRLNVGAFGAEDFEALRRRASA